MEFELLTNEWRGEYARLTKNQRGAKKHLRKRNRVFQWMLDAPSMDRLRFNRANLQSALRLRKQGYEAKYYKPILCGGI
ncbi:hypothetical protein LCGC14_2833360 [marine sediment metagenome]|uniref:Uncharacterized protein n=1 Tax=marine sediment metagenome TaxID=412755 RepID=A0A0F9ALW7_9ZZZZ